MELGKDYLIYDKVLTCCYISEEFDSVQFIYKNNKTPTDNPFTFGGKNRCYMEFTLRLHYNDKESPNTYITNICTNKQSLKLSTLASELTFNQVLSGELIDNQVIVTSNKEDGVVGEWWYDIDKDNYVQQIYHSIYVYEGIRNIDGKLSSFFDTGKLRKVSVEEMKEFFNKINKPMKKRFICPVSMECTEKQYINDLKEPLLNMGYEEKCKTPMDAALNTLVTNYGGISYCISNVLNNSIHAEDRYFISEYNPKLFLALAAMTNCENGNYGEYWKFIGDGWDFIWTKDKLYSQRKDSIAKECAFIKDDDNISGMYPYNKTYFIKATKEEIINFFSTQQSKEVKLIDGEYYYCKCVDDSEWIYIYKSIENNYKTNRYVSFEQNDNNIYYNVCDCITDNDNIQTIRLATSKEKDLLNNRLAKENKYFDEKTKTIIKKQEIMGFKTTRANMQQIYNVACTVWKSKIIEMVSKYAVSQFSEEIILPQEEVDEMFRAASSTQKETLKEVFPNYKENNNILREDISLDEWDDFLERFNNLFKPFYRGLESAQSATSRIDRKDLENRAIYIPSSMKVIVHNSAPGQILEFVKE